MMSLERPSSIFAPGWCSSTHWALPTPALRMASERACFDVNVVDRMASTFASTSSDVRGTRTTPRQPSA